MIMSNQGQVNPPQPPQPAQSLPLLPGLLTELFRVPVIRRVWNGMEIKFAEVITRQGQTVFTSLTKNGAIFLEQKNLGPVIPQVRPIYVQINLLFYLGRVSVIADNGTVSYHNNETGQEKLDYWRYYARKQPGAYIFGNRYGFVYISEINSIYPCARYEYWNRHSNQSKYALTYGLCFRQHDDSYRNAYSDGQSNENRQFSRFHDSKKV